MLLIYWVDLLPRFG